MPYWPTRGSDEAAGLDLYCYGNHSVKPGETAKIPVGIKTYMHPGWAAKIWDRSSLGSKGYHRFAGLIDSDYRGEWVVIIHNTHPYLCKHFKPGERVAQAVIERVWTGEYKRVNWLPDSERGNDGFGSSGK